MFKFKKFTIRQENSAMKVCTDSCLFGALLKPENAKKALDIGTGTGLLSLMLAQKSKNLLIDAIEIDPLAFKDAVYNISKSEFSKRINTYNHSIQDFAKDTSKTYDLIFTNPPFYQNQLKSPFAEKNLAHHTSDLGFDELAYISGNLLHEKGSLWVLLPPQSMASFIIQANRVNLHPGEVFKIRHNENKPVFREVINFRFGKSDNLQVNEILIYENHKYSSIFTELLKDYYLIF